MAGGDSSCRRRRRGRVRRSSPVADGRLPDLATGRQAMVFVGVVTVILGLIVALHPTGSLNVIAVPLGVLLVISGIFDLVRVFDRSEPHRAWLGIARLLAAVIGGGADTEPEPDRGAGRPGDRDYLDRAGPGGAGDRVFRRAGERPGWWIFFGLISLIARIVIVAVPTTSVTVLAVLVRI